MKCVAIIPARGGSKRIPRKNIKMFCGKPMIAWAIQAAQEADVFDRIIVSTDDDEIAAVATQCGAEAPFSRPLELANDFASTEDVILHGLDWLAQNGCDTRYFCCIYPTAPFLRPEYIRKGLELIRSEESTTAFSVTTYAYTIFRSLKVDERGRLAMFWPENLDKRSQDLPEAFHDAGQFYWGDARKFIMEPELFSSDSTAVILPRQLVQDIDTLEDWEVAERMFNSQSTEIVHRV